ncbi:MAG: thermonuclease family protein [Alphaproteobacteria bacterium]
MTRWTANAAAWLSAGLLLALGGPVRAGELQGTAFVLAGDEMRVEQRRVRLFGVRAPAPKAVCDIDGMRVQCGAVALGELIKLADGHHVSCDLEKEDAKAEPALATCYVDETDVNEAMVRSGWARIAKEETDRYAVDEADARDAGRGLWARTLE